MIYEDRPQPCRDFECGWLQMEGIMPDEMRPDRIHAVLTALAPGKDGFAIFIDPAYPLAYKDEPWLVKTIDGIVDRGGAIVLVIGNKRKLIQKGKLDEEMQA